MMQTIKGKIKYIEAPKDGFIYSNSLLIDDDIKVLIDTSCGKANIDSLLNYGIDVVIDSHFHEDHTMNSFRFVNAEIWAHEDDVPAIRSMEVFNQYYGFLDFGDKNIWDAYLQRAQVTPTEIHRVLHDRDVLDFGSTQMKVIHTPGHSPGHCCFLFEDSILFSVDIDLRRFGPWYGHMCSNIDDYIKSIQLCMQLKPSMLVTSHNGIITENISARLQSYLDVIFIREDKILHSLKKPSTLEELADLFIFYGPVKNNLDYRRVFEKMAIFLHLQRLLSQQRIHQHDDIYYMK